MVTPFCFPADESSKPERGKAPLKKTTQSDSALIGGEDAIVRSCKVFSNNMAQ